MAEKSKPKKASRASAKQKPPLILRDEKLRTGDAEEFLKAIMANPALDLRMRLDSARKLIDAKRSTRNAGRYRMRADQAEAATEATSGGSKFAPMAPPSKPKLTIVK